MASSGITLHASGAETASGVGDAVDLDAASTLRLDLAVTENSEVGDGAGGGAARSGARVGFSCWIEHSADNATWRRLSRSGDSLPNARRDDAKFGNGPALRTERMTVSGFDRYVRAAWSVVGMPAPGSVTFAVTGAST